METQFFIWLGVCFICYAFRTLFHVLENKKSSLVKNKKRSLTVSIAMFFLWFSWFSMVFFDPVKMDLFWMRYIGLILFVTGVLLFILSHIRIKGFDSDRLVTSGIYSRIRHPMYLGFILWIIGFPMFMQSIITLASSIIWIPQIMYWKKSEERQLEAKYREYGEYKKRTFF